MSSLILRQERVKRECESKRCGSPQLLSPLKSEVGAVQAGRQRRHGPHPLLGSILRLRNRGVTSCHDNWIDGM